jgi:hypothetical protein
MANMAKNNKNSRFNLLNRFNKRIPLSQDILAKISNKEVFALVRTSSGVLSRL